MTSVMSHEFQLATAETWPNPWPMYRALRDHDPVHHVVPPQRPEYDYYVLSPGTPTSGRQRGTIRRSRRRKA